MVVGTAGIIAWVVQGEGYSRTKRRRRRGCFRDPPPLAVLPSAPSLYLTVLMHGSCSSTLKRTVLDRGRHCPMVTMSPSFTFCQQGAQCTVMFLWRFSNLLGASRVTREEMRRQAKTRHADTATGARKGTTTALRQRRSWTRTYGWRVSNPDPFRNQGRYAGRRKSRACTRCVDHGHKKSKAPRLQLEASPLCMPAPAVSSASNTIFLPPAATAGQTLGKSPQPANQPARHIQGIDGCIAQSKRSSARREERTAAFTVCPTQSQCSQKWYVRIHGIKANQALIYIKRQPCSQTCAVRGPLLFFWASCSPAVLADEVQVVAADDDGVGHLAGGDDEALASKTQIKTCERMWRDAEVAGRKGKAKVKSKSLRLCCLG